MEPPRSDARTRQMRGLVALGVALARRGAMMKVAFALAAVTVLGAVAVTLRVAGRSDAPPLVAVSAATSSALAWGAGALAAFAATTQSLEKDRRVGIRALVSARGASPGAYLTGRTAGVVAVVALIVAGGALVTGTVTVLAATRAGLAGRAIQGALAATAYGLAFALTVAPLAMAALGARSRAGGYAWLVTLLAVPELLAPVAGGVLPRGWRDLASVPSALAALRQSLLPPGVDVALLLRASAVLAVVAVLSFAVARAELARTDAAARAGG